MPVNLLELSVGYFHRAYNSFSAVSYAACEFWASFGSAAPGNLKP
jgi:hypothetical protein